MDAILPCEVVVVLIRIVEPVFDMVFALGCAEAVTLDVSRAVAVVVRTCDWPVVPAGCAATSRVFARIVAVAAVREAVARCGEAPAGCCSTILIELPLFISAN